MKTQRVFYIIRFYYNKNINFFSIFWFRNRRIRNPVLPISRYTLGGYTYFTWTVCESAFDPIRFCFWFRKKKKKTLSQLTRVDIIILFLKTIYIYRSNSKPFLKKVFAWPSRQKTLHTHTEFSKRLQCDERVRNRVI